MGRERVIKRQYDGSIYHAGITSSARAEEREHTGLDREHKRNIIRRN